MKNSKAELVKIIEELKGQGKAEEEEVQARVDEAVSSTKDTLDAVSEERDGAIEALEVVREEKRVTADRLAELEQLEEDSMEALANEEELLVVRVARWLSASSGISYRASNIRSAEVRSDRVVYQLAGSDNNTYGIMTVGDSHSGKLCDPPEHDHEYKGSPPTCSCKEVDLEWMRKNKPPEEEKEAEVSQED
tara:strand:- start:222 stop:797 length:576 start_codon:yes stop_codon:yes gene_type:complete